MILGFIPYSSTVISMEVLLLLVGQIYNSDLSNEINSGYVEYIISQQQTVQNNTIEQQHQVQLSLCINHL